MAPQRAQLPSHAASAAPPTPLIVSPAPADAAARRAAEKALYKEYRRLSAARLAAEALPFFDGLTEPREREMHIGIVRAAGVKFANTDDQQVRLIRMPPIVVLAVVR